MKLHSLGGLMPKSLPADGMTMHLRRSRETLLAYLLIAVWGGAIAWPAEAIPLRAGPLSMIFEPDSAFLRHIKVGKDEVLRGISAPVRNQFWGTVPPQVKIVVLDQQTDHFLLKFDVHCREREIDFLWHGTITGSADGKLEYSFDGQAQSDFKRNRIGFCILHGESAAGRSWILETTAGEKSSGRFPQAIAPHQPAKDLRAVSHEFATGRWARVQFDGDVFEMEDQRNWTDASFKTYCTPLALPYPVALRNGEKVVQKVSITLKGEITRPTPTSAEGSAVALTFGQNTHRLPGLGLQTSSQWDDLDATEFKRLKSLHLDHLRVDLAPRDKSFVAKLANASQQAKSLGTSLIVGLHLSDDFDNELKRVAAECEAIMPPVSVWLLIAVDDAVVAKARMALLPHIPAASIGVGHNTNFTELNRNRPDPNGIEVVAYGMNPQVHAFDNGSIMETLPIQGETVNSARLFLKDLPLIISPVTLRVQLLNQEPLPGELPANVDVRQSTGIAAAWTLGSIRYLAESNVNRITYFETVGWKGIMASKHGPVNEKFGVSPGAAYPVYYLLQSVGEFAGGQVRPLESSDASSVVGVALSQKNRARLLLANLTNQSQLVAIKGLGHEAAYWQLKKTASENDAADEAAWAPFVAKQADQATSVLLPPYGVSRIDTIAK